LEVAWRIENGGLMPGKNSRSDGLDHFNHSTENGRNFFIGAFWWREVGGASVRASRLGLSTPFFNSRPATI
jgi:hypothetical protein